MAGWNVTLAGPQNAVLLTDSSGAFSFDTLPLGNYTVTLQQKSGWNRTLPASSYSYSVSIDSAGQTTTVNFGLYSPTAFGFDVSRFWNIVSVPVTVPDLTVDGVFPLHITAAYAFNLVYVEKTVLDYGAGYWIKFPFGHTVWLSGGTIQTDTTDVVKGWNVVGSVSTPVPVANLQTIPPAILSPYVYGYQNGSIVTETIEPGLGYWVHVTEAGQVIVSSVPSGEMDGVANAARVGPRLERISFGLASGETANLYLNLSETESSGWSISPAPPPAPDERFGAFFVDAGDGSARGLVATVGEKTRTTVDLPILVRGAESALTVSWDVQGAGRDIIISGDGGLRRTITGAGAVELNNQGNPAGGAAPDRIFALRVLPEGQSAVPESFTLAQNFPNPFNSTTLINFSLPVPGHVKLEIFNIVGEIVETLTDDAMESGAHSVPFEASVLPSGMYFYRMTADGGDGGRFTATKKLLLIR